PTRTVPAAVRERPASATKQAPRFGRVERRSTRPGSRVAHPVAVCGAMSRSLAFVTSLLFVFAACGGSPGDVDSDVDGSGGSDASSVDAGEDGGSDASSDGSSVDAGEDGASGGDSGSTDPYASARQVCLDTINEH